MNRIFWLFTVILGLSLAIIVPSFAPGRGEQDFIRYWSASKLFWTGQDPYDKKALEALEFQTRPQQESFGGEYVKAWDPPWLLMIMGPLTALPFDWAVPVWVFCNVALITIVLFYLWKHLGEERYIIIALFIGYLYGNTISLIRLGQITNFVLVSLLLGIYFLQKKLDWIAGGCFLLATIKPHLTFLFFIILFIWIIKHRRWRVFLGMLTAIIISCMVAWFLYPDWIYSYWRTISQMPYSEIYTSTFGSFMSGIFGLTIFRYSSIFLLLLAIPLANQIDKIGWFTTMNLALVISIPFSPYGFSFDQILLLPAIVQMIAWITQEKILSKLNLGVAFGIIFTYAILLWMMSLKDLPYYWFFWISFLIMFLYLIAWRNQNG
jgi:hypothetical protein